MTSKTYLRSATIAKAEQLVRDKMAKYDPSHDALHVWRVRRLALKIADTETAVIDKDVVELAALFHDLQDHKYSAAGATTGDSEMVTIMREGGLDEPRTELVMKIIQNVSFSTEKKLKKAGNWTAWHNECLELHCVQDADRLDAIGTFGIFRTAAYSAAVNRPLFALQDDTINSAREQKDLPKELPAQDEFSTYQHFFDKLLSLKDTMKTATGKAVGLKRHEIMAKAVEAIDHEFALTDFP